MGDAWGMNLYPGGGGAHQARPNEGENTRAMLALLREAGVRHVRWWPAAPGFAELLAEQGMTLLPSCTSQEPARYQWLADNCGVWLTQTTNEPDFAHTFAEEYVSQFLPRRAAAQRFSPLMCLAGPAIGGEMVGPGADYLTACYAAGLRQAVDAVDTHPYGKYATPNPPGGVIGGPEGLLSSLEATRAAMRAAGDAARPLIASETGHPTYEGRWFMPPSSYERQAQWIVRTNLLFVAAGVRRVIWYAFEDEGTDRANPEHCFGLVDWHGKPKPAFESYRTMTRLLSEARCEGFQPGLQAPVYGVRCQLPPQGGRPRYVTALWDSGGNSVVRLRVSEPGVTPATGKSGPRSRPYAGGLSGVVSLTGQNLPVPATVAGVLALPVDESVRYVYSGQPLTVVGQERVTPPVAPQIQMALTPTTLAVQPGRAATWSATLSSEFDQPVSVTVQCPNPWGLAEARQTVTVPARGTVTVPLSLPVPQAPPGHKIVSWDTRCQYDAGEGAKESFCRALFFVVR